MDVASFLDEIGEVLFERKTSSRELAALEFEADGRDIAVRIRRELQGKCYPPLGSILGKIGRSCLQQGIAVAQLRRITFLESGINVELAGEAGRPGRILQYPIEATLGSPTPGPVPLPVEPGETHVARH